MVCMFWNGIQLTALWLWGRHLWTWVEGLGRLGLFEWITAVVERLHLIRHRSIRLALLLEIEIKAVMNIHPEDIEIFVDSKKNE